MSEPHRANNTRFLGLFILVDDAQAAFIAQLHDALGQVIITDPAAELTVKNVNGHLS
jgi:hypothetical protein